MQNKKLIIAWKNRLELREKGNKIRLKGYKLRATDTSKAKGYALSAEGGRIMADGEKLIEDGNKLWGKAVMKVHGNVKMKWNPYYKHQKPRCCLENGEIYGFKEEVKCKLNVPNVKIKVLVVL